MLLILAALPGCIDSSTSVKHTQVKYCLRVFALLSCGQILNLNWGPALRSIQSGFEKFNHCGKLITS